MSTIRQASAAAPPPDEHPDLPSAPEMLTAFLRGDGGYDGVFVTAVLTTGIFCRPSCTARKAKPENVRFFATPQAALAAGYRPCRRCHPLAAPGQPPEWIAALLAAVEADPSRRWRDADLRGRGLVPERVRRWFRRHRGTTFHAWARELRLGRALTVIGEGAPVTATALDHGYESPSGFATAARRIAGGVAPTGAGSLMRLRRIETPLGEVLAGAVDAGLCLLQFVAPGAPSPPLEAMTRRVATRLSARPLSADHRWLAQVEGELREYFAGRRTRFEVPLALGGTPFQVQVWRGLVAIPHGRTRSYGALAASIGKPRSVRAVGRANGDNPVAIIVPCHRVIGADGRLTGYAGGLWRKQRLLALEQRGPGDAG